MHIALPLINQARLPFSERRLYSPKNFSNRPHVFNVKMPHHAIFMTQNKCTCIKAHALSFCSLLNKNTYRQLWEIKKRIHPRKQYYKETSTNSFLKDWNLNNHNQFFQIPKSLKLKRVVEIKVINSPKTVYKGKTERRNNKNQILTILHGYENCS